MVIPIIEQKQAVDNIDAIASVPGIDVLFIGASDLSYSLGVGGQREHPLVQEALAKVLAAGKKYNVPVGYPEREPGRDQETHCPRISLFSSDNRSGDDEERCHRNAQRRPRICFNSLQARWFDLRGQMKFPFNKGAKAARNLTSGFLLQRSAAHFCEAPAANLGGDASSPRAFQGCSRFD